MYLRFVEGFLSLEGKVNWHYRKYGKGKEILCCFHGYGFDAGQFEVLLPTWEDRYTIYSFDDFYHGKTETFLPDNEGLFMQELKKSWSSFLQEKHIDRFSMAGFSIGCRYVMALTELFGARITKVYLFAPGGLNGNRSFLFAVRSFIGKELFRSFVNHPGIILGSINLFRRLGFISEKLQKFSLNNIDSFEKRRQLYRFWNSLAPLYVSPKDFAAALNRNGIVVRLFSGTKDGIVPTVVVQAWSKSLSNVQLTLVPQGHLLLARNTILDYL